MGVSGLWDILRPAAKIRSLTELAITEGFEANPGGVRGFRIGIDASIWFFHAEYGKEGENPVLRTLFFRCATLMHSPFLPLFVFDGPKRPDIKRGKKISKTSHKLIPGMKAIVEAFGFEWRTAPGEAEAELAYLNRIGVIDGILSDDVDNFLFGAETVIRNPSNNLSGNRANPALNSAGKDDKNHTRVYRRSDITDHPDICLTRGGLILIGLMRGGDYHQAGVSRCGVTIAHGLAKCGFGDSLYKAATTLPRDKLSQFLSTWRHELRHELRTNAQGHIGRKNPSLANAIPEDFPDINILQSYVTPITSESLGKESNNLKLTWSKEPDLAKLAATCEFYFEWGYKEAIIKRFRTVIWPSAVLRILRRTVLELEASDSQDTNLETSRKTHSVDGASRIPYPSTTKTSGTLPKSIAPQFSSLSLGQYKGCLSDDSDIEKDSNEHLIVKIHSTRTHTSTDGILEYRLEIAPSTLVQIAESGIKGTRLPEGPDEWASDADDDICEGSKGGKKPIPDPNSHLRLWMPACMVRVAEPKLVKDFEEEAQRKVSKKSKKQLAQGRKASSGDKQTEGGLSNNPSPSDIRLASAASSSMGNQMVTEYKPSSDDELPRPTQVSKQKSTPKFSKKAPSRLAAKTVAPDALGADENGSDRSDDDDIPATMGRLVKSTLSRTTYTASVNSSSMSLKPDTHSSNRLRVSKPAIRDLTKKPLAPTASGGLKDFFAVSKPLYGANTSKQKTNLASATSSNLREHIQSEIHVPFVDVSDSEDSTEGNNLFKSKQPHCASVRSTSNVANPAPFPLSLQCDTQPVDGHRIHPKPKMRLHSEHPVKDTRTRKKSISSSPESDSYKHGLQKSPRKSDIHSSPRSISSTPLRYKAVGRLQYASSSSNHLSHTAENADVIELSSDSEPSSPPPPPSMKTLPPLLAARARATMRTNSATPMQSSLRDYATSTTKRKTITQRKALQTEDVIDLT
ncbi:hypothetical protein BDQ12DRAFT_705822 [Crucibulum laeve]|uniref:XPG-I domain-containing protein n=1 Tax=Crucibulum laeve TaxID=68775 RepID=A0A5C3LXU6_9AGAR|nr:hypothetical protein BDQ12DRAFT_705822 [Crucibulum laeve]